MADQVTDKLRRKIDRLPRKPGVYLMKSARNEVIYVGKAKDLRARVRSYFRPAREQWRLISKSIDQVADVDAVVTGSQKEALLLESNFIKQFRPRYNVLLRDDKSFVSIRIDPTEPWPRPVITRRLDDPNAIYFGPYASAAAARQTVRVLQDVFPLRRCSLRQCMERRRPCLYGEMGKCSGPCCDGISEEEYGALVDRVVLLLRGRGEELLSQLRTEMDAAAERLEYERAARLRDQIQAVGTTLEKQRVASSADDTDRDVLGLCTLDRYVSIAVLFIRGGNILDTASYRFRADLDSEDAILASFTNQFYRANRFIPAEVLTPVPTEDADVLAGWLTEKKGRKVRVVYPQRGAKRRLVELANANARHAEEVAAGQQERREREMAALQRLLGLRSLPRNIECFDISTLQGREAVGSMVVFRSAEPDKSSYRHYRIRDVAGQDDFAMMREVLARRYGRQAKGKEPAALPDLVLVDGGKGQLGVAVDILSASGPGSCEVAALAKARSAGGRRTKSERVFLPGAAEPIAVPEHDYAFRLLTRVRDEAHRFAVSYHRRLRRKVAIASPLLEVKGVGKQLARRLMGDFGSLDAVRAARVDELARVKGVSPSLAEAIRRHWREEGGPAG